MLVTVVVLSVLSVSEDSRKRKTENTELGSVTTKCRRVLKLKPSEESSTTQSSSELSSREMWGKVVAIRSAILCHPVASHYKLIQTCRDTAVPAAYLGLRSHLRAHRSQKLSKMGIQLFLSHGKDKRSLQKNTIHPFEVLTQHRAAPTPQTRGM